MRMPASRMARRSAMAGSAERRVTCARASRLSLPLSADGRRQSAVGRSIPGRRNCGRELLPRRAHDRPVRTMVSGERSGNTSANATPMVTVTEMVDPSCMTLVCARVVRMRSA